MMRSNKTYLDVSLESLTRIKYFYNLVFIGFLLLGGVSAPCKILFVEIPQSQDSVEWGPKSTETEASYILTSGTYESVLRLTPNGEIKPALATRWEQLNSKTIKFTLDSKAHFSNGFEVNSYDIKRSFEMVKAEAPLTASILSNIRHVEIQDSAHFKLHLKNPDPFILRKIATFFRIYRKDNSNNKMVGTGPWLLHSDFHHYFIYKSLRPNLLNTTLQIFTHSRGESIDQMASPQNGDLVLIEDYHGRTHLGLRRQFKLNISDTPSTHHTFGVFNFLTQNPLVHSKDIRRAINLALDRRTFQRLVLKSRGRLNGNLISTNEKNELSFSVYPHEPKEASVILKNWKDQNPQILPILRVGLQSNEDETLSFLDQLQFSLKQIGVTVEVIHQYLPSHHQAFSKSIDLVIGSDPSPYFHFDFLLRNYFHPKSHFFMGHTPGLNHLLTRVQTLESSRHGDFVYDLIKKEIYDNYVGVPGFQTLHQRAYSGPTSDLDEQSSLLNLSILQPYEVHR